ncbi:MAG: riboflavin synthase [Phycisphaeraceae bacterium]|nr:riboflavin synthase [Phycisphaeraceae bacterium]
MFTGIVQAMGTIAALEKRDFGVRLVIDRRDWKTDYLPQDGHSIAISGVCLTVVKADEKTLQFDVIPQTLAETSLGDKHVGDKVNLEPSLAAGQPMGGHFVQGHIDGTGTVTQVKTSDGGVWITYRTSKHIMPYIVPRGSVTVDGVSMTLADVKDDTFTLALIPTTLSITTLGLHKVGDRVNIETDILARTIVHRLHMQAEGFPGAAVNMDLLRDAGFVN